MPLDDFRPRPCLVCEEPCVTEGQLCRVCADRGHRVTDTEVIVAIDINIPASLRS